MPGTQFWRHQSVSTIGWLGIWVAVFLIGGAGSVLRFVVDSVVSSRVGADFPLGTLAINVSGSVVLGLLAGIALTGTPELLAGTAAVGAYTTFSTWVLESQRLGEEREYARMSANLGISLLLGLGGAALGYCGGKLI